MRIEESPPGQETEDSRKAGVPCPFCDYGILAQSLKGNYLVCDGCHRKVHEIRMTIPRFRMLLDAFDKLSNYCYDKELNRYAGYVGGETSAELEARRFAGTSDHDAIGPDPVPDLAIPRGWLKMSKLSETALSALNELRQDYEFDEGPGYLEDVLDVLRHLTKRSASQSRLRRQLEIIPYSIRESLSRLLVEDSNGGVAQSGVAKPQIS
jgi:hypothetical protein